MPATPPVRVLPPAFGAMALEQADAARRSCKSKRRAQCRPPARRFATSQD